MNDRAPAPDKLIMVEVPLHRIQEMRNEIMSLQTENKELKEKLWCADCGLAYASAEWCDCVVSDEIWAKIAPEPCVLCFNCMTARAVALGMERIPITIRSGPWLLAWDDLEQQELNTRLQAENKELREKLRAAVEFAKTDYEQNHER